VSDPNDIAATRHHLRNQLNNITMNAELVKLQIQQSTPPEKILLSIERMLDECKACGEFLNNLSDSAS